MGGDGKRRAGRLSSVATMAAATATFVAPWNHRDFSKDVDVTGALPAEFGRSKLLGPKAGELSREARPVVATSFVPDGTLLRTEMSRQAAYVLLEHARRSNP